MYVCSCNAITEHQIQQAIAAGADTLAQLREALQVTGNCGKCLESVLDCLRVPAVPEAR